MFRNGAPIQEILSVCIFVYHHLFLCVVSCIERLFPGTNDIFILDFAGLNILYENFRGKYSLQLLKMILIVSMTKMMIEIIRITMIMITIEIIMIDMLMIEMMIIEIIR